MCSLQKWHFHDSTTFHATLDFAQLYAYALDEFTTTFLEPILPALIAELFLESRIIFHIATATSPP